MIEYEENIFGSKMFLFSMYSKIYFLDPDLMTSLKLSNLFTVGLSLTEISGNLFAFAMTTLFRDAFAGYKVEFPSDGK